MDPPAVRPMIGSRDETDGRTTGGMVREVCLAVLLVFVYHCSTVLSSMYTSRGCRGRSRPCFFGQVVGAREVSKGCCCLLEGFYPYIHSAASCFTRSAKRPLSCGVVTMSTSKGTKDSSSCSASWRIADGERSLSVSYTHLTLPTKRIV